MASRQRSTLGEPSVVARRRLTARALASIQPHLSDGFHKQVRRRHRYLARGESVIHCFLGVAQPERGGGGLRRDVHDGYVPMRTCSRRSSFLRRPPTRSTGKSRQARRCSGWSPPERSAAQRRASTTGRSGQARFIQPKEHRRGRHRARVCHSVAASWRSADAACSARQAPTPVRVREAVSRGPSATRPDS